ncbi:MAG TPA: cupin domain-containing protein [Myxococcota bacterium]|nr:cupin domain-containing protein [Myxococcota bacterium]HON24480.1 cupin domain-containing protein [Myxococcota bacterium]HOS61848.1 cupin domain-containing protein [Myxococcota bacterium]HPC91491.1 cupin domain-containing protein [Myxococcota bacterium]HPL25250.1 cupin domain-containing protein [Myxococcota bacterium]
MVVNKKGTSTVVPITMPGAKGVSKEVTIGKVDGTPEYSMRIFTVQVGGNTPFHGHPYDHVNYIVAGKGMVVSEAGETPVEAGDSVLVLPDELHQYKNVGDSPFVFICMVKKDFE